MFDIRIDWRTIKSRELPMRYIHTQGNYYIYCTTEDVKYTCVISDSGSDAQDFVNNYQESATSLI